MTIIRNHHAGSSFECVDDVVKGLAALEYAYIQADDARGAFVTAYLAITELMKDWILRGRFIDDETTSAYVVAFANRYRSSLETFSCGDLIDVPNPWRLAFHVSDQTPSSWIHSLLLGINAHINYDLPFAILDSGLNVASAEGHEDHVRINNALMHSAPTVRRRVLASYERRFASRIAGNLFGKWFDTFLYGTFRRSRATAWDCARLLKENSIGNSGERIRLSLDENATLRAQKLLATSPASVAGFSAIWAVPKQVRLLG